MNKQPSELITLSTAHITQHSKGGQKSDWSVEANITNDRLTTLPKTLDEKQVFGILKFARFYELEALNAGIEFQKGKQNEVLLNKNIALKKTVDALVEENERLSTVLDDMTQGA